MSYTIYRITIKYKDSGKNRFFAFYRCYDHSKNFQYFIDENGLDINLFGSDEYVDKIIDSLRFVNRDGIWIEQHVKFEDIPSPVVSRLMAEE